jgi:hypothetical protein
LTLLTLIIDLTSGLIPARNSPVLDGTLKVVCLANFLFMTLQRTLRPGPVTLYRVVGGIAGYLLIGYTWAFCYQLLMQQKPASIHFEDTTAQNASGQMNELIDFSFVTLTTVGYGDVHAVHPVARSLAVAEALIGQLYVAILIASLVGMALQTREEARPRARRQSRHYRGKRRQLQLARFARTSSEMA